MKTACKWIIVGLCFVVAMVEGIGQQSVARQWNELLLDAIRNDYARPTSHSRNLYHTSMAMYDAWAAYDTVARTFFIGNGVRGYFCPFDGVPTPSNVDSARNEAISYAMYRILKFRFANSPGADESLASFDTLMVQMGYDTNFVSTDYASGIPAALGNYIGEQVIAMGGFDDSNEMDDFKNMFYEPVNDPLFPVSPGNPEITDPNRWQPLTLDVYIDQAGNEIPIHTPEFLGAEWGAVIPFALTDNDLKKLYRGEDEYWVYHDPGQPPYLDSLNNGGLSDEYKWNFSLVSIWGSHLDPADSVMIDISPASFGNNPIETFPTTIEGLRDFYNDFEGGDYGTGYDMNPVTGQPYEPQIVPRGDYTRVLAEFWADGPDSETPPGHWFTILNHVSDHPLLKKQYMGDGPELSDLEWDIKAYFILGGAVHDAAVAAWGIKGWHDYIRPISAIRCMADLGQCSDTAGLNYHPAGIPLVPGYIEQVTIDDEFGSQDPELVGDIKLYTWRGPDYIEDPDTSVAGVGWILAGNWWPYQRPSFVTPPFAGYVSGHSTFSRAAAEVMTLLTGDPYFPGGMSDFFAPKNEFLVFEDGPSVDITLQWATYRDASDQTSLSRIWGGIHPPADDIPGRLIGAVIGVEAFAYADCFFNELQVTYDTVQLACRESTFDWPLDVLNVTFWEWEAEGSKNIEGASEGETDEMALISDQLVNLSDTAETITYYIYGYVGQCQAVMQQIEVTVEPLDAPQANFFTEVNDSSIIVFNNSIDATSYLWNFGDGSTDTTASPTHVYNTIGEYEVVLIVSNACGQDTFTEFVQINSARISDVSVEQFFSVSPNPTNGAFQLIATDIVGEFDLSVFSVTGELVEAQQLSISGPTNVKLNNTGPGVYYATLENDAIRDVVKIVVQ